MDRDRVGYRKDHGRPSNWHRLPENKKEIFSCTINIVLSIFLKGFKGFSIQITGFHFRKPN